MPERLAKDRHSSLLWTLINYGHKKLCNIGPTCRTVACSRRPNFDPEVSPPESLPVAASRRARQAPETTLKDESSTAVTKSSSTRENPPRSWCSPMTWYLKEINIQIILRKNEICKNFFRHPLGPIFKTFGVRNLQMFATLVFTPSKTSLASLMFVGKAGSLPYSRAPKRCFNQTVSSPTSIRQCLKCF
jgi:hypothetical protein